MPSTMHAPSTTGPSEWRAEMLALTEGMTRSGSARIDMQTGEVVATEGLYGLLQWPAPQRGHHAWRLLRGVPREEHRHVVSIWGSAIEDDPFEFRHRLVRADGQRREVLQHGVVRRDACGRLYGYLSLQDVTEQHLSGLRIQELASTDPVTGLPNRRQLLAHIEAAIDGVAWDDRGVVVLSIKVDQIDHIQQSMGYGMADELAQAVARRLRQLVKTPTPDNAVTDTGQMVARVESAEFAVVLRADVSQMAATAHTLALQLMQELAQPERLGWVELVPAACVGVALFPDHGVPSSELLEAAQMARQNAAQATDRISVYSLQTRATALRQLALEAGLRRSIERGELHVAYRPQADLDTGKVVGAEALLMWTSAELGEVPTSDFVAVAERTGLIVALGSWVREQVYGTLKAWKNSPHKATRVWINLSPIELQQADTVARIQGELVQHDVDPALLGIEVSERALIGNPEEAARKLSALQAIGVEVALDNFGIGASNIGLLRAMPFKWLKIHPSFAPDVTDPPQRALLLRAITHLAHSMGNQVIAQGADNEGRLSLLLANGCNRVQGLVVGPDLDRQGLLTLDTEHRALPEHLMRRTDHTRTLLLVDDDPSILSSLKRVFRGEGYRVLTANSGLEGLEHMAQTPVDVVLSDQRMPHMTGVEFLRRAKSLYPHTVRLVLSGYTEIQSITDAVNEGAIYRFLTKPWEDEQLRHHVREAFAHKGLSDENERLSQQVQDANRELASVNQKLAHVLKAQSEQMGLEAARASVTRHMLDQLPVPALGVDGHGVVVMCNTEAFRVLGGRSPVLGDPIQEVLGPTDGSPALAGGLVLNGHHYRVKERPLNNGAQEGRLYVLLEST